MYEQAQAQPNPTQKLQTQAATVHAARFAHKYAGIRQLEVCDTYLANKVEMLSPDTHEVAVWGPIQWIGFSEQHHLFKTLAAWECRTIRHFADVKQDILDPKATLSCPSLTRICHGLHELFARSQQHLSAMTCNNIHCGASSYGGNICPGCLKSKLCQLQPGQGGHVHPLQIVPLQAEAEDICPTHANANQLAQKAVDEAMLFSWQHTEPSSGARICQDTPGG